jgi:hypothetical protein
MAAFSKFNCLVADLANKIHNLGADTLKVALTNVAPVATNTVYANLTPIVVTNIDSVTLSVTSSVQASGVYKLIVADKVMTASGVVDPFRYVVIYNDLAASKNLICFYDRGSSSGMATSETLTLDFDQVNGVFSITIS